MWMDYQNIPRTIQKTEIIDNKGHSTKRHRICPAWTDIGYLALAW